MRDKFNAGCFEVSVTAPYPCWIDLRYGSVKAARFSHDELPDLLYILQRAAAVVDAKLSR